MARDGKVSAIIMSGNLTIGYKMIGPFSMLEAIHFCEEIKKAQNPDIAHTELMIIPVFSPDEARQEIEERGHLMSPDWLCLPRR